LDGETTLNFAKWAGKTYKGAYIFEPEEKQAHFCEENTKGLSNVKVFSKGLWDKEATLEFLSININDATELVCKESKDSYVAANLEGDEVFSCRVTSLDEQLKEVGADKVTFIKMDIEGSEYNAIKGMEKTIKKNLPKLAVSVYHKKEDLIMIPLLLLEYCGEYRFYLRHYDCCANDTVLYAVI